MKEFSILYNHFRPSLISTPKPIYFIFILFLLIIVFIPILLIRALLVLDRWMIPDDEYTSWETRYKNYVDQIKPKDVDSKKTDH